MITGVGAVAPQLFSREIGASAAAPAAGAGSSFAATLSDMATRMVGTLERSEQVSMQAMKGEADTREVVDAVMSAEQALQAAVAIRDKIVTAYLEISRMGI